MTCGWKHVVSAEPGAPPIRSVPVAAVPVRRRAAAGVQAFLESTEPDHVLAAAILAAEILGMLLDDADVPRFGEHRDELAAQLAADRRRPFRSADAEPSPGGTRRGRDQGGTKVTVQVVLHAEDDSQTVVREVFTLTREAALAPDKCWFYASWSAA